MVRKIRLPLFGLNALSLMALMASMACEQGPPTYALLTMKHDATRIQIVTVMKVWSEAECEAASREFVKGFLEGANPGEWRETERTCQQVLEPIYQRVMNKEKFHATYLILRPKGQWKYESRIVIFGVPSSEAQPVCEKLSKEMEKDLEAEAECVQGTIG
jgi:hypothetical protein